METMRDKVVMITGAAAGIGLACAEAFAKEGATTILVDINKPEAQARKLMNEGYQMIAYGCDVSYFHLHIILPYRVLILIYNKIANYHF